jgi:hypothetical protein
MINPNEVSLFVASRRGNSCGGIFCFKKHIALSKHALFNIKLLDNGKK